MLKRVRVHVRSNFVGYIALFFALGLGSAWAATELGPNSVGPKEIKKNAVKEPEIAKNAVREAEIRANAVGTSEVANASLLGDDFAPGQLPAGPRGPQGEQGERGQQGPPGKDGATNVTIRTADSTAGTVANTTEVAVASCQPGERVTGGGIQTFNHASFADTSMVRSNPVPGDPPAWDAAVFFTVTDPDAFMTAYIICAAP